MRFCFSRFEYGWYDGKKCDVCRERNGCNTKFWNHVWCGEDSFATIYPRAYALEKYKDCSIQDRHSSLGWKWDWHRILRTGQEIDQFTCMVNSLPQLIDSTHEDRWSWNLYGKKVFTVSLLRKCIDHHLLPKSNNKSRWNTIVPKKVNLFVWRLLRNGLPMSPNLFARGIDVNTFRCLICNNGVEYIDHIFCHCRLSRDTRAKLQIWLNLDIPNMEPQDLIVWCDNLQASVTRRRICETIFFIWWWHIWKARNNMLHNELRESSDDIFNSITSLSFLWMTNRGRKIHTSWEEWIKNPLSV